MSVRPISFGFDEYFHVYNRGTDKRVIFLDRADHIRFLELLFLCNSVKPINVRDLKERFDSIYEFERGQTLVSIGAYCLMPNHFHLLLRATVEGGISKFMNKLSTAYSMYFNKRYERNGALFQGKFKAEHVDSDEYLKYLFSYIHLNPVKLLEPQWKEVDIKNEAKAYSFASSFPYSSLFAYIGEERQESFILNKAVFPEYFSTQNTVKEELFEWLTF